MNTQQPATYQPIRVETKTHVVCQSCGGSLGTIDHLSEKELSQKHSWYCDDCGDHYSFQKLNGVFVYEKRPERYVPTLSLLKFYKNNKLKDPLYLVVKFNTHLNKPEEKVEDEHIQENRKYYFDEHTCPWNWLRIPVYLGDDNDPHGVFRHVQTIEMPSLELLSEVLDDNGIRFCEGEDPREFDGGHLTPEGIRRLFSKYEASLQE